MARRDRAAGADRGAEDDEVGAPRRVGRVGVQQSAKAELAARCRSVSGLLRVADDRARRARSRRIARAIDEPIRPMPISASLLKSGSAVIAVICRS